MYFFIYAAIFFSAIALNLAYKQVALRLGIYDVPNHRSAHTKPIPVGAGVVFLICALPAFYFLPRLEGFEIKHAFLFFVGSVVCTVLGFIDDIKPLSALKRLAVQGALAVWVLLELTNYLQVPFEVKFLPFDSVYISFGFGVLFIMWMINLFNFMDGLDGLLGSHAFLFGLMSFGLCYLSGNFHLGQIYLIFPCFALAFLWFNWRPAKMFMGDAGAYFLGFSFALLGLIGKVEYGQSLVAQIILMGTLISDATLTLLVRIVKERKAFGAHKTHGFQILKYKYGWKTSRIVWLYAAVTVGWFAPWAWVSVAYPLYSLVFVLVSYVLFITVSISAKLK